MENLTMSLLCASILLFINSTEAATEKLMFVFGDSLFDAGNNQYYTPTRYIPSNHHPYGMALYTATGRFSDGLLVPDFIAKYEGMPLIPPALDPSADGAYGYNFACAGAGVYYNEYSMNLEEQLSLYKNLTLGEAMLQEAVYMLSMAGNDYSVFLKNYENATDEEMQDFVDYVIRGLKQGIQEIYETGGRKFAFQDVGPLGCLPAMKYSMGLIDECYEKANTMARLHNIALRNMFQNLTNSEQYPDIKYGVFDYYHQLLVRITNSLNYGFNESVIACCGYGGKINGEICGTTSLYFLCSNPSAVVFFDAVHTTQALNSQLANIMWAGNQTIISPYNVKQLFDFTTAITTPTKIQGLQWDQ